MRFTTKLARWFSNSRLSLQDLCIDDVSNEFHSLNQSRLYTILKTNVGLCHGQILGIDFDEAGRELSKGNGEVTALIAKPDNLPVAYHTFHNDDKYFLLDNDMVGYQDSDVYGGFYANLPFPTNAGSSVYEAHEDSLWIMPRAQYGHFIYDEVLPVIATYAVRYNRPPSSISLIFSRSWQALVVHAIAKRIFGTQVPIIAQKAPSVPSLIRLTNGLLIIPSYWRTYIQARRLMADRPQKAAAGKYNRASRIFLSRKGFDKVGEGRILNNLQIYGLLMDNGFAEIAPHEHDLDNLFDMMATAELVVSEPGTTPLIGYLCAPSDCSFVTLFSYRCLTECEAMYCYSGWRYHLAWITAIRKTAWGFPTSTEANPFSDICWYNPESILTSRNG